MLTKKLWKKFQTIFRVSQKLVTKVPPFCLLGNTENRRKKCLRRYTNVKE